MSILSFPASERIGPVTTGKSALALLESAPVEEHVTIEERTMLLLLRDLLRLGWQLNRNANMSIELVPPREYDKDVIKQAMAYSRNEVIDQNALWIKRHLDVARANLASGEQALTSHIHPRIEVCQTQSQHDLFRIFRYHWSSPFSDYVGRRIRLLIRDDGLHDSPLIGIAALGSSIIHIPDRDQWVGWDTSTRSSRIVYAMDAYVVGAMPPYSYLLGGKLISYVLASDELRAIFKDKYAKASTIIKKRTASELVLLFTSSLYGKNSSQYNRLRYGKSLLYRPIGTTSGYGSLHISNQTFRAMLQLAKDNGGSVSNRFGAGPNWRMRVIRSACEALALDSDVILRHSFRRGLYAIPLTTNFRAFLKGRSENPRYRKLPLDKLVTHWRDRWLAMRKRNEVVLEQVKSFRPDKFIIEKTACDKLS